MPTSRCWTWRGKAVGAAVGAVAGLLVMGGTASAAPVALAAAPATPAPVPDLLATPAPGTNLIKNGNFESPSLPANEGATPTDWSLVDLGAETDPYDAAIGVYNAAGKYPPPKGNPNPKDVAVEAFYEAGTATGVEGIGGQQTSSTFGSITQANIPQISFSDVETSAPEASVADWAGSGLEIIFTSGGKTYTLVYLNPWTAYKSTFSGKPTDSATTKYILGPTLTADVWNTQKGLCLNAGIKKQFGLTSYQIKDVRFIDLEDTTNSGSPYPNMDGYVADVAITEGSGS
jgi:hypothetical protein